MLDPIPFPIKSQAISSKKQILVYLTSFFLPPFGLIWAFKYLKSGDSGTRRAGFLIIALTVVSIIDATLLSINLFSSLNNEIQSQTELLNFEY